MASRLSYLAILAVWIAALWFGLDFMAQPKPVPVAVPTTQVEWPQFFVANILPSLPIADEFDTPLRPPDGAGVVNSLPYLEGGQHLGEDWTTAQGDAALGEPVYSIADGWVSVAYDFANAWGKVIFIDYRLPDGRYPPFVEVMYAQLQTMDVTSGQFVKRGQKSARSAMPTASTPPTCIGRFGPPPDWVSASASTCVTTIASVPANFSPLIAAIASSSLFSRGHSRRWKPPNPSATAGATTIDFA